MHVQFYNIIINIYIKRISVLLIRTTLFFKTTNNIKFPIDNKNKKCRLGLIGY